MTQVLLDGTAETVSVAERLEFLRVLEDSTTPITMYDPQGRKHLVFVTKVSYARPENPMDKQEEPEVTVTCVDASDGLWDQPEKVGKVGLTVAYTVTVTAQTNFVWGPAAADTWTWNHGVWQ